VTLPALIAGFVDGARNVESPRDDGLERDETYGGDPDYARGFRLGSHDIRVRILLYQHERAHHADDSPESL